MAKYAPHTSTSALARARAKVSGHKTNVVGMCAHEIIVNILGIPGPWKWGGSGRAYAVNYFLGAQKVVKTSDPAKIPAGAVAIWGPRKGAKTAGGLAGHIALGDGGGYCLTTDLPRTGYWGRVKITEVTRLWGKPLLGYVLVDGMGYTLTDKPAAPPKPVVLPKKLFRIETRNLGFMNPTGEAKWRNSTAHRDAMQADIEASGANVLCVQELLGTFRERFDQRMAKIGLKNTGAGSDGRFIFVDKAMRVGKVGTFDLRPRYKGDDKQAAWAQVWPNGAEPWLIVNTHTENEDESGNTQVGQESSAVKQGRAKAKELGIHESRVAFVGDMNSRGRVLAESLVPAGWQSAFVLAASVRNAGLASITGWVRSVRNGPREDVIALHKSRRVRFAGVRKASIGLSDHLPLVVDVGQN